MGLRQVVPRYTWRARLMAQTRHPSQLPSLVTRACPRSLTAALPSCSRPRRCFASRIMHPEGTWVWGAPCSPIMQPVGRAFHALKSPRASPQTARPEFAGIHRRQPNLPDVEWDTGLELDCEDAKPTKKMRNEMPRYAPALRGFRTRRLLPDVTTEASVPREAASSDGQSFSSLSHEGWLRPRQSRHLLTICAGDSTGLHASRMPIACPRLDVH